MSEIKPVSCNEQPVSSYEPVYQSQTGGEWHDVTDKEYAFRRELSGVYKTRILYPAAAYEALKAENEAQAKRIEEVKGFLEACVDDSMSRNNRQQLAGELLDMLHGDSK